MSSKKEILNNEEWVKVIEEADRKRELFSHYDFYLYDPENYKTILTEEPKDRKIKERKYRAFILTMIKHKQKRMEEIT